MERDMTAFIILAKGISLIMLSLAAFAVLAWTVGYEPAAAEIASRCDAAPAPVCMFTIL